MHKSARFLLLAAGVLAGAADPPPASPPSATQTPAQPPAAANQTAQKPADKTPPAPPTALTEQMSPEGASGIIDTTVHGSDGSDIGHIIDVLVDDSGKPKAAMIDFGGFLGVGSRKVAVAWGDLHFKPAAPEGMMVTLDLDADQIRTALLGKETKPPATVVVKKDPAAPAVPAKPSSVQDKSEPAPAEQDKAHQDTAPPKAGTPPTAK